jgi:hypothetical protein
MEKSKVHFLWLRGERNPASATSTTLGRGKPVTLVAYEKYDCYCETWIRYTTSTCGPNDVFNRRYAHDQALGRLVSNDDHFIRQCKLNPDLGPSASICSSIMSNSTKKDKSMLMYDAAIKSINALKDLYIAKMKSQK